MQPRTDSRASSSSHTTRTSSSTCQTRPRRVATHTSRSASQTSPGSPSAPERVGTALAGTEGTFKPLRFACALIGSVFIQIGTNLANDYSDARRGADTEDRLGPVRVTAGGLMPPRNVLIGTYVA